MARLRRESSRSYLGRSARHAAGAVMGVGLRPSPKGLDQPPNPTAAAHWGRVAASWWVTPAARGLLMKLSTHQPHPRHWTALAHDTGMDRTPTPNP